VFEETEKGGWILKKMDEPDPEPTTIIDTGSRIIFCITISLVTLMGMLAGSIIEEDSLKKKLTCKKCRKLIANVHFLPCNHTYICVNCIARFGTSHHQCQICG
jgi:hypothetical protein